MTIEEGLRQAEQGYLKIVEANSLMADATKNAFLFTWRWWLGIALIILPWTLWFMFRKKESTNRLLLAGFTSMLLSYAIESIAMSLGKWSYPFKVVPFSPMLFLPFDLSMLPVAVMFFIQLKPNINPFIKAIVFGVLGAFVLEPIFEKICFYNAKDWLHTYDFFLHSSIFLTSYWLSSMNNFEKIKSDDNTERGV
ncbi:CBO0543 family protein [Neobacillus vireti]|uniref:CBO0543 family protein n=1 Tax=Neobacillus vireti TaxID=220686 RepID=UPI002FFFE27D